MFPLPAERRGGSLTETGGLVTNPRPIASTVRPSLIYEGTEAPVSRSEPNTLVRSSNGRLEVTEARVAGRTVQRARSTKTADD